MANTTLELLAGLNLSASEKQIAADIQVLQKRLEAAGIGKIKLTGEIDKELLKAVQDMAKSGGLASAGKNLGEELATNLINSFNIKSKDAQKQIKSLSKSLFRMSVGEARSGTENPAFLSTMNYLGKVVETNANIIQQRMGIYDDFYNYFQKLGKIKIPDIVKSDLGKDWDDMRKAAAGKFVTNKPGIELDSIYQEMAGKYKDIFSGTADQTQQFREIVSTLKAYQADIGKMKPLDAAGIEDFWNDLVRQVGFMQVQIKQNLDQIPADVDSAGGKIKTALLDINKSFSGTSVEGLTADVKEYFQTLTGMSDKDISLKFFKNAEEEITSFHATIDKGAGIVEQYRFSLDNLGQFSYSGGNLIDKSGADFDKVSKQVAEYQQKLESLKSTYKTFLAGDSSKNPFKALVDSIDFSGITDSGKLEEMIAKFRQAQEEAKALNASINKQWSFTGADKMTHDLSEMGSKLDILEAKFNGAKFQIPDNVTQTFQQMRESLSSIHTIDNPEKKIAAYNQLQQQLRELADIYSLLDKEQQNLNESMNLISAKKQLGGQIVSWMASNKNASRDFDNILVKIITDMQDVNKKADLDKLAKQFRAVKAEAEAANKISNGFWSNMKQRMADTLTDFVRYQAAYDIINRTKQSIRDMIQDVEDLQASMIEFNKVANVSQSQLEEFTEKAYQTGNKIARTGKDIVDGMSEFRRAGYDVNKVLDMSEAANVMVNVADGIDNVSDAASSLIAVLRAYDVDESQIMSIVDILNEVSNNSPVGFSNLADGLERTAGTLAQTGTTLQEDVGLLTGGFAQLRNMEKVANGLITISQRLRGVGEDGQAIDGYVAKLQGAFSTIGVDIQNANGELRSTYDIINDYAKVFPDLTSMQKQYFGELASGKRQVSVWNAIVSGIDDVNTSIEQANDSLGSAARENEIYMNSIQGSQNAFMNAMDTFANTAIDDQWISDFINAGTSLLNTLTNIIRTDTVVRERIGDIADTVKNLAGLLENLSGNKFLAGLAQAFITIKTIQMGMEIVGLAAGAKTASGIFEKLLKTVKGYGTAQDAAANVMEVTSAASKEMNLNLANSQKGILGMVAAIGKFAMANPWIVAGTMALVVGYKAWDNYANRVKYAKEALDESKGEFESVCRELASVNEELKENQERMDELNSRDKLTFVEKGELERLKEINKELERNRLNLDVVKSNAADDLAEKNRDAFDKEYGDDNFSLDDINILAGMDTPAMTMAEGGLEGLAAAILKVRQAQEQAKAEGDTEWLANMEAAETEYEKQLEGNLTTLQGYRDNLTEIMNYRDLTEDEQAFYNNLEQGLKLIYQFTDPNAWNNLEVNDIFNADGIERTKSELVEMAKAGKLDEDTLAGYRNLNKALSESDMILVDGKTVIQAFLDEIYALAEAEEKASSAAEGFNEESGLIQKQKQISAINQMSEGFEELDKIMDSMQDKDKPFDYALLDDDQFKETFSGLGDVYTDFVEKISDSPKDVAGCKQAFNDLVTVWLGSTGVLDNVTDANAALTISMLENMGVANADSVVTQALAANKEIAALSTDSLTDAAVAEILALADEGTELTYVQQKVLAYAMQKQLANGTALSTDADIHNIMSLVSACGSGIAALQALADAKKGIFTNFASKNGENLAGLSKEEQLAYSTTQLTGKMPSTPQKIENYSSAKKKVDEYLADKYTAAENAVKEAIANVEKQTQLGYNGGVKTGTPDRGSGGGSRDTEKEIDGVKQKVELLRKSYEALNSEASNSENIFANQINYLNAAIDKQEELVEVERLAADAYKAEWDSISSGLPDNVKEAITTGSLEYLRLSGDEGKQAEEAQKVWEKYEAMHDALQNMIDLSTKQIQNNMEQISLLQKKLENYEWNSDKYQETVSSIQDLKDETAGLLQNQLEWNAAILQIPIDKVGKMKDQLQQVLDALNDVRADYDTAINAVVETINRETEAVEGQKETVEESYQKKIDSIQETIDSLQDAKDEEDELLKIEKARAAFEKARSQKTNKVMKDGEWQWTADLDEINSARQDLEDTLFDKQINDLEKQQEALEKERDDALQYLDDEISRLEKLAEKWQQISKDAQYASDSAIADKLLGPGWKDKVTSGKDDAIFEPFREAYLSTSEMIDKYQKQIDTAERLATMMEQYVQGWQDGSIAFKDAVANLDRIFAPGKDGLDASEFLNGLLDFNGSAGNGDGLSSILANAGENLAEFGEEFELYFSVAQSNTEAINQFTQSWEEMAQSIIDQMAALEEAFKAQQEIANKVISSIDRDYGGSDDGGDDFSGENNSGGPGFEQYLRDHYGDAAADAYVNAEKDNGNASVDTSVFEDMVKEHTPYRESSSHGTEDKPVVIIRTKKHDGIRSGLVDKGLNLGTDERVLQAIATQRLKPDETAAILKRDETVMTPEQVDQLMANMREMPGYVELPKQAITKPTEMKNVNNLVNVKFGDIYLDDVNAPTEFAISLTKMAGPIIRQQLGHYKIL